MPTGIRGEDILDGTVGVADLEISTGFKVYTYTDTVVVGSVVYADKSTANKVGLAKADDSGLIPPIGIATVAAGGTCTVAHPGSIATGLTSLTTGSSYWLSTTAGTVTATKPAANAYGVGIAISTTEMLVTCMGALVLELDHDGKATFYNTIYNASTVGASPIPDTTQGTYFAWIPEKGAIRAGQVTAWYGWNASQIGICSIGMGSSAGATGDYSVSMGLSSQATGYGAVALGGTSYASGSYSFTAGDRNIAQGTRSVALGNRAVARRYGELALASAEFIMTGGAKGNAQRSFGSQSISTTDTNPTEMSLGGDAYVSRWTIPADTSVLLKGNCIARKVSNGDTAAWQWTAVLKNIGGTTSLVGSATVTNIVDEASGAWSMTVTADNTNDSVKIDVTGASGVQWVTSIDEVLNMNG